MRSLGYNEHVLPSTLVKESARCCDAPDRALALHSSSGTIRTSSSINHPLSLSISSTASNPTRSNSKDSLPTPHAHLSNCLQHFWKNPIFLEQSCSLYPFLVFWSLTDRQDSSGFQAGRVQLPRSLPPCSVCSASVVCSHALSALGWNCLCPVQALLSLLALSSSVPVAPRQATIFPSSLKPQPSLVQHMASCAGAPACSSDGKALSKLAQKVPSPKKSGNVAMDQRLQVEHDAMVWVIDRLSKNPQEACHIQTYMPSRAFSQALSRTSSTWSGGYKTLDCLPKSLMLKYLLQRLDSLKVTTVSAETLKALEVADANHVPTLFSMDLQLPLSVSVRPKMIDTETICMQILAARAERVGDRLRHFAVKGGLANSWSAGHESRWQLHTRVGGRQCKQIGSH